MNTDQPFNPYGWVKQNKNKGIVDNNTTCPNYIGIDRYIPYMVIKTDNFNTPQLLIWSFREEDGYLAASDLNWISFQNDNGIFWILNGGSTLSDSALLEGGRFVWVIRTIDEFSEAVLYVSNIYEYNTACPIEIKLNSCSDVFPYLFVSGINESNFTADADIRIWVDYGLLNSEYETNYETTEKKKGLDIIDSVKVTKISLIKLKLSNSMADMIQAMATMSKSVLSVDGSMHMINNPKVKTEMEDEEYCGSCIVSWESSSISSAGCCGEKAERIILPISIEYEGTINSWTNHEYTTNGQTKTLQIGQYAILNSGFKTLVLKQPDGKLKVVESLSRGDILHWRNHDYSAASLYAYSTDNDPNTSPTAEILIGLVSQSRVAGDVIFQSLVINPTQIRVTINSGTPTIHSSTLLLNGTLNIGNVPSGTSAWIEVLDSSGNWIEDTDQFTITV